MFAIVSQSTLIGWFTALLCTVAALAVCAPAAYFSEAGQRNIWGAQFAARTFDQLVLVLILPSLVIHPALSTLYLSSAHYLIPGLPFDLGFLERSPVGIYIIGAFLYLPFAYLYCRRLPLARMLAEWRRGLLLGLPLNRSFIAMVVVPAALYILPFLLFLEVLVEGMVFVPFLNEGDEKQTLGRVLYSFATRDGLTPHSAQILIAVLAAKILGAFWIAVKLESKGKSIAGRLSFSFLKYSISWFPPRDRVAMLAQYAQHLGTIIASRAPVVPLICGGVSVTAFGFIVAANALILLSIGLAVRLALVRQDAAAVWNAVNNEATGARLLSAAGNTFVVALGGALIGALVGFIVLWICGHWDRWKEGPFTRGLWGVSGFFALIPAVLYGYLLKDLLRQAPHSWLILSMAWLAMWLILLSGGKGLRDRVFSLGRACKALSLDPKPFWFAVSGVRVAEFTLLFLWALLLNWNDVALQLFSAPAFLGLPNQLLAIGKDGLTEAGAAVLGVLQILILAITTTIAKKVVRRDRHEH